MEGRFSRFSQVFVGRPGKLKAQIRRYTGTKKPAPAFAETGLSPLLAVFISRPQAVKSAQENSTTNTSLYQYAKVVIGWYYMLESKLTALLFGFKIAG